MGRNYGYSPEDKIHACEDYLQGKRNVVQICADMGMNYNSGATVASWIRKYETKGAAAFCHTSKNKSYSKEFKKEVVEAYLRGEGSYQDIINKYDIRSTQQLRNWIKCYNSDMELKDYIPKQEVYMAEARRKTTIEERKTIVEYCVKHNRDYKNTAVKYDVSYSQVYSWVKKYDADGEDGLADKRGRHKADDEVDELECLRRENLRLKRQLEEKDMAVELLKKVKEYEGM